MRFILIFIIPFLGLAQFPNQTRSSLEYGLKVWNWDLVDFPDYKDGGDSEISDFDFERNDQYDSLSISKVGERVKFKLNPLVPVSTGANEGDYNFRTELSVNPWRAALPLGTEEWFGWSYTFGANYIVDTLNQWVMFQCHEGTTGFSPPISLDVLDSSTFNGTRTGEINLVIHADGDPNPVVYIQTGIVPVANETVDIVVNVVWGDDSNGYLKLWMNGNVIYDQQRRTVYAANPVSANAKWGIYKFPWRNQADVQESIDAGITEMEMYMGALKIVTLESNDPRKGKDLYELVKPE